MQHQHVLYQRRFIIISYLLCAMMMLLIYETTYNRIDRTKWTSTDGYKLEIKKINYKSFNENAIQPDKSKTILFYTSFFGDIPWGFVKPMYFKECSCPYNNCVVEYDKNKFAESDVVIFHGRDMPAITELTLLNRKRSEDQRWAYFILESPMNSAPVQPLDPYFNWSISYRTTSDFWMPYGRVKTIKNNDNEIVKNYAEGKIGQIAWYVSHCGVYRDNFAKQMENSGLQISVGGGCATRFQNRLPPCKGTQCSDLLRKYKFYFAAENGFCEDYITEKYYYQSFLADTIPIVLGGANYSNPRLAIPGSYINPLDFKTFKDFVEHLKMLDKNDTAYNEYFKWKSDFKIETDQHGCEPFVCDICKELHKGAVKKSKVLSIQIDKTKECDLRSNGFDNWFHRT